MVDIRGEEIPMPATTIGRYPLAQFPSSRVSLVLREPKYEAAGHGLSLAIGHADRLPRTRRSAEPMAAGSRRRDRAASLRGRSRELSALGRFLDSVRAGESRVLVVCGEPGIGKTALLDHLAGRASGCRVARATGVQSEMELPFAGLHQLCAPMLDRAERLPVPQREALRTAFGLSAGPAPDRFLVGLAVLGLLSEVAGDRPLICVVDDEQWLDRASAQTLGFVARRLAAEPVGLVFAACDPGDELAGLPELPVAGLPEGDAGGLLDSMLAGPLDARIRDQIVSEARGNPLALLELPRGQTPAQLAGGFGLPGARPLSGRIEESFRRQLEALPAQTRRLLQLAAADPSGDPFLVWRAAGQLGIPVSAGIPAAEAGLVEFGARVRFRHPLVRSAAYRSASVQRRQEVHRALAEATDPQIDPDRRAWHHAQAAPGPDEEIAGELERSAGRVQAHGGLAAAAAFLERAAMLTPGSGRRLQRLLAAARAMRGAGALDAALGLLMALEAESLDQLQAAEMERLRGQIALDQWRGGDAARLLLGGARRLEPVDAALARAAHLDALGAAVWISDMDSPVLREAAGAARAAPPGPDPPRAVDVLLDAVALRLTEGYAAAAPALCRALKMVLALDVSSGEAGHWLRLTCGRISQIIAMELWDFESWYALAAAQVQFSRDTGALMHLTVALNYLARANIFAGELATAARLVEEDHLMAEATGNPPIAYTAMMLAAWRGEEQETSELVEAISREAAARDVGRLISLAAYASSVLHNGLGQHDTACDAARLAFEREPMGLGSHVVPELAEAAARTGDLALVEATLKWLSERTRVTPTDWVLGIEARARALLCDGDAAESCYQESIERLGRTRVRAQLARAHLLYGEWLRRNRRRGEAREQLRTAYEMLDAMGIGAFAERARRELQATGETARKRTVEHAVELTAQEAQVARLAREGLSNPEIGARLFISKRTVQYHLGKVFTKLGISSRSQLSRALPGDAETTLWVPRTSSTLRDQAILVDLSTSASLSSDAVLLKIDRFGQRFQRRRPVQETVRPVLVVVVLVVAQDPPQMALVPDKDAVQELAPASPDPAFGNRVHAGRPHVAQHGPDPGTGEDRVECGGEVRATVAEHELHPLCLPAGVHDQVAGLLGSPFPGGVQRDAEDADAPRRVPDHGQDVGLGAVEQVDADEVAGQDCLGPGAQDCDQAGPVRRGAGSMPLVLRISHAVDAATLTPRPVSSSWILR